jgi:uncharacterized iron-regulated protein
MTAEALALVNALVREWNRTDGRTARGKRLRYLIARADQRLNRRLTKLNQD